MDEEHNVYERYRSTLQIITEKGGELKDYTYLALLVTETGKLFTTEADFLRSGVVDYAEQKLGDSQHCNPRLLTLTLNLAELMLKIGNLRTRMVKLVDDNLQSMFESKNDSVLTALFQFYNTFMDSEPKSCSLFATDILTRRIFLDNLISLVASSGSIYLHNTVSRCFLGVLHYLSNKKSSIPGESDHVNLNKLRQNLLLDFFDKCCSPVTKLSRLKYLLKNCLDPDLEQELKEFVQSKLTPEERTLTRYNCSLLIMTASQDDDCIEYLKVEPARLQMLVVYEMIKLVNSRPGFQSILLDYFEKLEDQEIFLYFLNTPRLKWEKGYSVKEDDICSYLSSCPKLYTLVFSKCRDIWIKHQHLPDETSVKAVCRISYFLRKSAKSGNQIDFLEDFLRLGKEILARYIGVPNDAKVCFCDLICQLFSNSSGHYKPSAQYLDHLLEVLFYLAASPTSAWNLKDSVLAALIAILKIHPISQEQKETLMNVMRSTHADTEMYVREETFKLMSAYILHTQIVPLEQEEKMLGLLEETILNDQEAIVRRGAVDFLSDFVLKISDDKLSRLASIGLHCVTTDPNWEVKLKSANFWSNFASRLETDSRNNPQIDTELPATAESGQDELVTGLEGSGLLTALLSGCQDFETCVRERYEELADRLMTDFDLEAHSLNKLRKLDLGGKNGHDADSRRNSPRKVVADYEDEDLVQDMIESVVEAEDCDLVRCLAVSGSSQQGSAGHNATDSGFKKVEKTKLTDFLERINSLRVQQRRQEMDGEAAAGSLGSVLEDILQSVSGEGMVEVIDCY